MKSRPLVLVSAAVLLDKENRVLLAERPLGKDLAGMWEFPGGKVEAGETPEAALVRELKEELDITVDRQDLTAFTFASHSYDKMCLLMPLFTCRKWTGSIYPKEGQKTKWVTIDSLEQYSMPPADMPIISILQKGLYL